MKKGEPWGRPTDAEPDREVSGDDAALAAWVASAPGALVRLVPEAGCDIARAVGVGRTVAGTELPMDALVLADGTVAVNMVVLGPPPDRLTRWHRRTDVRVVLDGATWFEGRATTVLVAVGQWLRGNDVVPRGHPGDGRAEVQVYRLRPAERAEMRRRLPMGGHVPHPRLAGRSARQVDITAAAPMPLEVDGKARPPVSRLSVEVRPNAYRLLV